jgi:hypothetical protein
MATRIVRLPMQAALLVHAILPVLEASAMVMR